MLYDQRWDAKTKADPFTLPPFVAWLEKQPAHESYTWTSCYGACLLDLYIADVTGKPSQPGPLHLATCGNHRNYLNIAARSPWTFGAALTRARAVLAEKVRG